MDDGSVEIRLSSMLKKSNNFVLASLRGSPYAQSTLRLFARCGFAEQTF